MTGNITLFSIEKWPNTTSLIYYHQERIGQALFCRFIYTHQNTVVGLNWLGLVSPQFHRDIPLPCWPIRSVRGLAGVKQESFPLHQHSNTSAANQIFPNPADTRTSTRGAETLRSCSNSSPVARLEQSGPSWRLQTHKDIKITWIPHLHSLSQQRASF